MYALFNLDETINKYNIPLWTKRYVYRYIKRSPVNAANRMLSFIEIGRKKGRVTRKGIFLPNGMFFDINFVSEILYLFYYGEKRISESYERWAEEHSQYSKNLLSLSETTQKHARAIRNMIDGLRIPKKEPNPSAIGVFDFIDSVEDIKERIVLSSLILKYSYGYPFGFVFYKAFYPASSEFMRSFGKVFLNNKDVEFFESEAKSIILKKEISQDRLLVIVEMLLEKISYSIEKEIPLAKKAGVENEIMLLNDISIAYPLHIIKDLGIDINPDKEADSIIKGTRKKR